jgi:hypothetical protein
VHEAPMLLRRSARRSKTVGPHAVWRFLVFDHSYCGWRIGGWLQNGTHKARGFASQMLESRTGKRQGVRPSDLPGVTTNNEADYVTLITAPMDLRGRIERPDKSPRGFGVAVRTESQLLVEPLTQGRRGRPARTGPAG